MHVLGFVLCALIARVIDVTYKSGRDEEHLSQMGGGIVGFESRPVDLPG